MLHKHVLLVDTFLPLFIYGHVYKLFCVLYLATDVVCSIEPVSVVDVIYYLSNNF